MLPKVDKGCIVWVESKSCARVDGKSMKGPAAASPRAPLKNHDSDEDINIIPRRTMTVMGMLI